MSPTPLIIGHRGASAYAPENTLAAFKMAIDAGADGIEFDVQLAADGVPVVIHDATLDRTAMRTGRVADLTSDELGDIGVGRWFNVKNPALARSDFEREIIPTLKQVLDLVQDSDVKIYIELKCGDNDFAMLSRAVCDVIRGSPMIERMIVKSFKLAAIPEVRHLLSEVQTAALFEPSIMTILRRRRYIIAMAREFGAHQISLHCSLATPKLTDLAKAAGMPITIWTADNPAWVARGLARGVGSIITNDPGKLLAIRGA